MLRFPMFRWTSATLVSALALLSLAAPERAASELLLSPANMVFELGADRPSGTISLTNTGAETVRYRAKAVHFQFSETGSLMLVPPDTRSLAGWLRFNPTELEVPPNARQVVRYSILVPKDVTTGEYWGAIEFEPLKAELAAFTDPSGRKFDLKVISSALVVMMARKGTPRHAVTALSASLERGEGKRGPALVLVVQNTGQAKIDLTCAYELAAEGGQTLASGELPKFAFLADSTRILTVALDQYPVAGKYEVRLKLSAPQLSASEDSRFEVTVNP